MIIRTFSLVALIAVPSSALAQFRVLVEALKEVSQSLDETIRSAPQDSR